MKRYLILTVIALVVLAASWAAFAQREGSEGARSRSPEERARMRERWQNMSEEERGKFRAQMRERWREGQIKPIEAIEEQIAKLKAGTEATGPEARRQWRELSDEERTKLRERFAKAREERQKAIIAQIARLQGQRRPTAEGEEFILVNTGELKEIRELAVKEKATETAQRLERLIAGRRARRQRPETPVRRPGVVEPEDARKAPAFTLNTFDGKEISLSDYRGKIVVLEWFNFECPYSRYHYETTTTMVGLANKYKRHKLKGRSVVWLVVNSTSHTTPGANKEFTRKYKLPFPILDDRSGKVGHAYGAKTTPHMYIISPRGNILYDGAIDNSPLGRKKEGIINYVDKALAELTSGKAVSTPESKPYGCSVKYPK